MKYVFGLAAMGLFALGACSGSEPEQTAAPEPDAMVAPAGDADMDTTATTTTDEDCTPPNCDTGGGTRPVEEVTTAPQR